MTCYTIKENGKTVGFLCGDFGDPCSLCGAVADNLCDYPIGDGKTCSAPICDDHSIIAGDDKHYCVDHSDFSNVQPIK